MTPAELAAADVDPFCAWEAGWLRHLELSHPDVIHTLRHHLPDRPRVEEVDGDHAGDHDLRLAFERPIATLGELSLALRRLAGCPFLALRNG